MQSRSTTSSLFSTRELRRLLRLYRSRELTKIRRSAPNYLTTSVVTSKNVKSNPLYTFYGSRGALSPNQRTTFRSQISRFDSFKGVSIKLSLFSTSVAQGVRLFSHLREISSLFKGSTYQRTIQASVAAQNNSYTIQKQTPAFFDYIKATRFSEESTMDFTPSLMIAPNQWGAQLPRRFAHTLKYSQNCLTQSQGFFLQAGQLAYPTVSIVSRILYKIDAMEKKNKETSTD